MTLGELIDKRGWTREDFTKYFADWYDMDFVWNNRNNRKVTYFDILCVYPFYRIHQIYTKMYEKDNAVGSTYDVLSEYAPDDFIREHLEISA